MNKLIGSIQKTIELAKERLAWKLSAHLPDKLIYFCAIRLVAYASSGKYSNTEIPDLTWSEAVSRYSRDRWGWA